MIQVYINNEEVVSNKEFTIHEELLNTSSTILNNCYPKTWETTKDYVSNFYYPDDYSNCEIYNGGNLIFAGVVKNSAEISLRPTEPKYCSLQILDYKTLLSEGQTLDYVIPEGTIEDAIDSVISAISSYGFQKGNIVLTNGTDIMAAYSTLDKTPYDVFQYIAEISGSKWFTRMIDKTHTAIDFYSPELMNNAQDIEYNTTYFENNNIVDISFSYSSRDYRNKQVITSDEVFNDIDTIEALRADGSQKAYELLQKVATIKSIYVNGTKQTIGTATDKENGIYADFYYSFGTNQIESNIVFPANTLITITYTSLIKGRQVVVNQDEIDRISTLIGRNGTIARYETRNDTSSNKALAKIADSYIKFKGTPEINLTVTTQDNDLFEVGQQAYFNAPIDELKTNYMVKSKDIQITKTGNDGIVFYTYILTSNFDAEKAINFFDNQRRKRAGNIAEDEYITRNIDINSRALIIFDTLTTEEITPVGDNTLNAPLNAPFIE